MGSKEFRKTKGFVRFVGENVSDGFNDRNKVQITITKKK
jgi:hypothetical protein